MKVKSQKSKVKRSYANWLLLFNFFFLIFNCASAQQNNLPLNREWELDYEKYKNFISENKHKDDTITISKGRLSEKLMVKPNDYSCFKPCISSLYESRKNTSKSLFIRKLKKESLFIVKDTASKFHLTIDPLFNFEYGQDKADSSKSFYKNTRGALVRGDIGKKFSFETSFLENQATFVKYIDAYINSTNGLFSNPTNYQYDIIPGQGRAKTFKKTGYDYAMASGYVSYSPSSHFNFQIGHGKHFVGDGYRSLLLSDNAFNYPFARITSSFGQFQYTNLYASFINLTTGGVKTPIGTERLFQKKSGSFQFLSWNAHERIQIGLFQGMIWEATDSTNRQLLDAYFFNPVIGSSLLRFGLNNTNNVLIGLTGKLKITHSFLLYGDFMMDHYDKDFFGGGSLRNKHGFQAGVKYFDFLTVKNLHVQLEYNETHPYSYAHKKPEQSYTHYNQPLAHPLGANFTEAIGFINYRIGDFFAEVTMSYAVIGKDSAGKNYGNTIFNSDNYAVYGINSKEYFWLQGIKTTLTHNNFHIGYLINPSTNLNVVIGASLRNEKNDYASSKTEFFYIAICTSLSNVYYDF